MKLVLEMNENVLLALIVMLGVVLSIKTISNYVTKMDRYMADLDRYVATLNKEE